MKYGIKYLRVNYANEYDILIPRGTVKGDLDNGNYFSTDDEVFQYITDSYLDGEYVIGDVMTIEELRKMYNCPEAEMNDDSLVDAFYDDYREKLSILRDGRRMIVSLYDLFIDNGFNKELYQFLDGENCVFLNQSIIEELQSQDESTIKEYLQKYSDRIANFEETRKSEGIDSRLIKDGKEVETTKNGHVMSAFASDEFDQKMASMNGEFSVRGLYNYLKAHIIGHDEQLKKIATILYANYTSNPYFGTESILVPGPTGTGKTATFECASKYFNVPFANINSCNLVPDGLVGTTVEDEFLALINSCGGDVSKAEKSILVFDEFDKLGRDGMDYKQTMVQIFLKILEGGRFPINRQMIKPYVFNTYMSSKVCLGVFEDAYKQDKGSIGFATSSNESKEPVFDTDLIIKKGYFSKELLSRIQHTIPYKDLTDDEKKRVILESKLSTYMRKKERFEMQYGIKVEGDEEFALGVMDALRSMDKSVRDINNIISEAFLDVQWEVLDNLGKYKRLVLSRDTVKNKKFDLG